MLAKILLIKINKKLITLISCLNIIGLTTKLNWREMLSLNGKKVTQKIYIRLKIIERYSINITWLIK